MLKIRLFVFMITVVALGIAGMLYLRCSGQSVVQSAPADECVCGEGQADLHEHEAESESDEHNHEVVVSLKETAIHDFGIEVAPAQGGIVGLHATLPAEITLNADTVAHITPRIAGVACSVSKNLGDKVAAGEVLAVIHSRELSDYKAGYLGAREKLDLAETLFEREKTLWEKKITAEQDYLNAKRQLADARIEMRSAEQKLHALGFSQAYLDTLRNQPDESFIVYEIAAPIAGTIIEKHITLGESLKEDSEPFVIADLSRVWVKVSVHQKDLPNIRLGQKAVIRTEHQQGEGSVSYISGLLEETTRTAPARIVLPNEEGTWRPGTFVTALIYTDQAECTVVAAREAIVTMEGKSFVFLAEDQGFVPREVQLGKINDDYVEIVSGLEVGQRYVVRGAFTLKSEMLKSNEDPCGGH
ncbi:MAG: efflux RND transporter periplasmic adaptor subunit [Anaerohalosphaeraceae bacterium]